MITSVMRENCYTFYGKSTDEKPVKNVCNGSIFHEIDTSDVYLFDEESHKWYKLSKNTHLVDIW